MVKWTSILSQALIHLNDQPIGPIAPKAKLGTPAETTSAVKLWKSWETATVPTLTLDQWAMLLRTQSPITPWKGSIYWNLHWDIPPGWVNCFVVRNYSVSTGISLSCCKPDLLNALYLEWNMPHWKKGEGGSSGLAYPAPTSAPHTWWCSSPANMYGMHNQVKFLKLPTSLSSRLGGHILFSTSTVIWLLSLFLHWPAGHYTT